MLIARGYLYLLCVVHFEESKSLTWKVIVVNGSNKNKNIDDKMLNKHSFSGII